MPKGSLKLTNARKEEIINACELLYKTMSFKEITMKDIASATSFTRTSIYNYFETKEEIFLALLKREYELWVASLNKLICEHSVLTLDEASSLLARSLAERKQLLKLLSMNHYDMEQNSRAEKLVEMKTAYGNSMKTVNLYLQKFCRGMSEKDRENFIYIFFPFMFGAYPYAVVTDKQKEAMKQAKIEYSYLSVYEILYNCIKTLLG